MNEPSARLTIFAFTIVAVLLIGAGALLYLSQPEPVQITINPPIPTATDLPTATPSPLLIYVTGAVQNSGITIELPPNSRVQDAIEQAGGVTDAADLQRVNLVGILRDGDQVHVPDIAESVQAVPTEMGGDLININTATIEELTALPNIGTVTAERIVAYREANGDFAIVEDLLNIEGIGERTLENIRALVRVE